ncbi:hypothetical protein [Sphingosinicella xenopeptidilytica]|uniref:Uncharacterized protein n=1 Tax=Sphingosinicella xenopeptidilytica TaxID=364098 RepID=A0ABW3C2K8_SPHXN
MAFGIKIMNAAGDTLIDTSFRVGRLLGHVDIDGSNQSGTQSVPGMSEGDPFYIFEKFSLNNNRPTVVFNTGTNEMEWTAGTGAYTGKLFYGVH